MKKQWNNASAQYTQVASSAPKVAVQNTVTNSKGQIVSQVDFKNHGIGAESGHAHIFPPNQINMGHHIVQVQFHIYPTIKRQLIGYIFQLV